MNKWQREWKLKDYFFTAGSRHPAVNVIKRFLMFHPRVSTSNLRLDDIFDEQTYNALLELQRYKYGSSKSSAMSKQSVMAPDLYKIVGAEMSEGQLEIATFNDELLDHLLRGHYQPLYNIEYFRVTEMAEFKKLVTEFFKIYGKVFRRTCWKVFATDRDGNSSNVAQRMERPGVATFPFNEVVLGYSATQLGGQGRYDCDKKFLYLASNIREWDLADGSHISAKDQFFRTLAHEYANQISCKHTGNASTFGTIGGISGQVIMDGGIQSIESDSDSGARFELEMWGSVGF